MAKIGILEGDGIDVEEDRVAPIRQVPGTLCAGDMEDWSEARRDTTDWQRDLGAPRVSPLARS